MQLHYERALRPPEKRHEPWRARVAGQLDAALAALDREAPASGWIAGGDLGLADITVACAFGFVGGMVGDLVATGRFARLARVRGARRGAARLPPGAGRGRRRRAGRARLIDSAAAAGLSAARKETEPWLRCPMRCAPSRLPRPAARRR